jgi:hypothetical protein
MRKETVTLYTELLSRHLPGGLRGTRNLKSWHLPGGTEGHKISKVLAFTWRDFGGTRNLNPGIYLEGLRDTINLKSWHLPGGTEEHHKSKVLAFTWRD